MTAPKTTAPECKVIITCAITGLEIRGTLEPRFGA
jgi:hypothetical protein